MVSVETSPLFAQLENIIRENYFLKEQLENNLKMIDNYKEIINLQQELINKYDGGNDGR